MQDYPIREIVKVERPKDGGLVLVTLDCGHVARRNPIYTYNVGAETKCFHCGQERKK